MNLGLKPLRLTKQLKTGIKTIDSQHETYLVRVNEMLEEYQKNDDISANEFKAMINYVWEHLNEHFSTEENVMIETDYNYLDEHKVAHHNFRDKFLETREKLMEIGFLQEDILDFIYFLRDDFFKHISVHDKALALFLQEKANEGGLSSKIRKILNIFKD